MTMRTPSRRLRPMMVHVPKDVDLGAVAERVSYEGSAEHKTFPSSSGRPRADATKCDPDLHGDFETLTGWLRRAVARGRVGAPWEGGFPRYVWVLEGGRHYTARLVNREVGTYKGWEIDPSDPSQLPVVLR